MQRNECKPGTEVIIRGTISEDDGMDFNPIKITIRRDDGKTEDGFFDPSALEPAQAKYDPARKYRKGDLVRITGFHGRLFGSGGNRELSANNAIGGQVALCGDEIAGGDVSLPDGVLLNRNNYLSAACIELVKPIEEIEAEQPYVVTAEVDVPGGLNVSDASGQHEPVETGTLGYDAPRMTVRGDKFPAAKAQWLARVKRWVPALADCANLEVANLPTVVPITPADAEHRGYDRNAISHELIGGQINGKSSKIKWGKVKVDVRLRATDPPATAKQYFPEFAGRTDGGDRWIGLIPFEVTTTNVAHARYLMDDKGTVEYLDNGDGPVDPGNPGDDGDYNSAALYVKFTESIYKATRIMPYDGSATVHDDFDQVCGGRLSITGGLREWETMRSVIQEITLDLKTGASDVTVGAAEQLSLQDSIDKSKQLADALRNTSQASASTSSGDGSAGGIGPGGGGVIPSPDLDDKKPELPSVGPSVKIGQAQESPAMGTSAVEVGFQCRLAYDDAGKVNEAYIRQGKAMYAGNYIGGMLPEGAGSGGWVKSPTTSGEVWLKVQLDKDAKYMGSYLSAVGGVSDPVTLATEKRETPYDYYFHLATIDGNKVVQHQAGTVYLQIHPGTFGPSGKS